MVSKYWRVFHKDDEIPSFAKLESDHKGDAEKVIAIVLRGLQNPALRMALLQIRSTLTVTTICDKAKEIGFALPAESNQIGVNTVTESNLSAEIKELTENIKTCFAKFDRKKKQDNGRYGENKGAKRKGACHYCLRNGHWARECRKRLRDVKEKKITERESLKRKKAHSD